MSGKIERPRGTHDVVPAEMPLWQRVTGEVERLCALYGYRKVLTPVFEDTALFARTSGQGSDVVQKEMYNFTDRSDRPLTLRPEGTAPICRAYVEHGMQRDPQPVKMFTIAPMYRYGKPGKGRYREHWQASVEAIGSDDPSIDAELIQLYDTLLHRLGVTAYHLELNSIGCRTLPSGLPREARAPGSRTNEHRLDADTRAKVATSPLRVFDNYLAKPEAVRAALDEAPKIGESLCEECVAHFACRAGRPRRDRRRLHARSDPRPRPRLLHPHDLGVHRPDGQRELDHLGRRPLRRSRRGDRRPADARGRLRRRPRAAASSRWRMRVPRPSAPTIDVFFALDDGAPRSEVARMLAELRAAGLAVDTDYAGRSLKGQQTQAARLGAAATVVVGSESAVLRRPGQADEPLALADVVGRLSGMTWRDIMCGELREEHVGTRKTLVRLGGAPPRPRRARLRRPPRPHRDHASS